MEAALAYRRIRRKQQETLPIHSSPSRSLSEHEVSGYATPDSELSRAPSPFKQSPNQQTSGPVDSGGVKLISEAMPSVLLSLGGLMLAGTLLDALQKWTVFERVPELFILVPTLLGLKGNLEMNLASRLSTAANLGLLDKPTSRWELVFGNMALLQVQAACVSGLASTWSLTVSGFVEGTFLHAKETALICAAGILTACVASMFLGGVMCGTVIVCRILNVDPDNIATPVAASMGDLITLLLLAAVATGLNAVIDSSIGVLLIVFSLSLLPLWVFLVLRNKHVKDVLMTGWSPLFTAMLISSLAGIVLGNSIDSYAGLAVLVPVMNGICGNLACIYASKISTELHQYPPGFVPNKLISLGYTTPIALFMINVPAQLIFLALVATFGIGAAVVSFQFVILYFAAACSLAIFLLRLTAVLACALWKREMDPDNYIFSLITATGDVVGTVLIVQAFRLMVWLGAATKLVPVAG
ncbi:MgtE-domain-containing protein [Rhizoclosmatium globosum]|uniref:MgtE-domain-containing protein n=1 Tax=Rhizoclosmatium globosum TaxID=329046 RepID=A0A1Y2CMN9_9FUNG|nr:MgtE-domain-containing protein [Rhizoclosmatium globosum]|eukprot:ORY48196.1 MgtE-domain-containing protein [Rhizoclosmatium globosum]